MIDEALKKYTDMKNDNTWLERIANECAETNTLLRIMIDNQNSILKKLSS